MRTTLLQAASLSCALAASVASLGAASAAEASPVRDGKIGYVLSSRYWAVYQEPGAKEVKGSAECPKGFNDGPREQFAQLFPLERGERTVLDTQLARERAIWFPTTQEEPLVFREVEGKTSFGLDLDGKVKDTDFTSPEGKKGIDNQLYRVIGCISMYRGPEGTIYDLENDYVTRYMNNRLVIEISGVDSLVNDDDVTVNSYRGFDNVLTSSKGAVIAGGTQRIDERWAKFAQAEWKAKIVNGVLISEPGDLKLPASGTFATNGYHKFKGLRFQLNLTPERAEGMMAGYVDVAAFYHQLNTTWATHFHSYGQLPAPGLYRALRRLADGYPDPKTGEMTAISSAMNVKFVQVYVIHPRQQTVSAPGTAPVSASSSQ